MSNETLTIAIAALAIGVVAFLFPRRSAASVNDQQEAESFIGPQQPRGIRNNNPGNIEYNTRNQWRGQTGSDGRYAIFDTPQNGIRAMAIVLRTYMTTHNLTTIREVINRWAPPTENLTGAYATAVSQRTGIGLDEPLSYGRDVVPLVKAIIHHENGYQPYSDDVINAGVNAA